MNYLTLIPINIKKIVSYNRLEPKSYGASIINDDITGEDSIIDTSDRVFARCIQSAAAMTEFFE